MLYLHIKYHTKYDYVRVKSIYLQNRVISQGHIIKG